LDQNKSKPVGLNESTLLAASIAFTEKQVKSVRSDINELYEVVQDIAQNKPLRGPEGAPGKNGAPGPQGEKGERGIVGAQGLKGDKGDKGDTGEQGEKGNTGEQGPKGDTGETGERGLKGDKGDTGEQGLTGAKGDQGEQGPQGDKGDTGERGAKGDRGDTGEQGPQGEVGAQGIQGEKGDAGPQGERGEKGERGLAGSKGDTGERGLKGDTGEKGDKGDKGDPGKDADTKPLEEKWQSFEKKIQIDLQKYKQNINQSVSKGYNGWGGDSGGGEVRLLRLDDVDTTSLANGKTLVYNADLKKLVFQTLNNETVVSNTVTSTSVVTQNAEVTGDFSVGTNSSNNFISYASVDLKGNVVIGTNASNSLIINSRIASNIVPIADVQYNLGSPELRFKDLFLSGNTVHIGSSTLSSSDQGLVLPYGSTVGGVLPSDDISGSLNNFTGDLGNFDNGFTDSFGSQIRNVRIDFNQSGTLTQIQLGNL
jgi:hypothetical protein